MRSFPVDVALAGDPGLSIKLLQRQLDRLNQDQNAVANHNAITQRFAAIKGESRRAQLAYSEQAIADSKKDQINKRYLSYCIGQAIDDSCVIFNEYDLDPQLVPRHLPDSWFENSIASGLGWSLGAALGGQIASPEQTMVVTLGDGSYLFNTPMSAHHVAGSYNLPIVIIIFNDSAWSTIKKSYDGTNKNGWAQRKDFYPLCNFDLNVPYDKIAEASGNTHHGSEPSTHKEEACACQCDL